MPKFYPLSSLRLGLWQSLLHLPDQLFVMIQAEKFIFVCVHPPKQDEHSSSTKTKGKESNTYEDQISFLFNKKKILKYFGNKNPFTTVTDSKDGRQDVDFFGVVTFEVHFNEIVGMEYLNMLVGYPSSRFVFEARTIIKRSFVKVEDFFNYYKLPTDHSVND